MYIRLCKWLCHMAIIMYIFFYSGWVDLRGEGGPGHHPLLQREHLRGRVARGQETGPGQVHSHCPGLPTGLCLTGKLGLLTVCINRKDGGTQISSNALSVQRSMLTPQQLTFLLLVLKIINVCWRNKNPKYLTQKWNKNRKPFRYELTLLWHSIPIWARITLWHFIPF